MTMHGARLWPVAFVASLVCVNSATSATADWFGDTVQIPFRDLIGYFAASLVLATFCMKSINALRVLAIASNVAFATYGYLAGLAPVFLLHAVLLPVNVFRLAQSLCARREMLRTTLSGHSVTH